MIAPHLIFAHLLADYVLQTNWLATRKEGFVLSKLHSWDGLLLHGAIVWVVSLAVVVRHIGQLWPYITILALVHTTQDALKVWINSKQDGSPLLPYLADQGLHLAMIFIIQDIVTRRLDITTSPTVTTLIMFGASIIAVTRFWEVSWWSNWPAIYGYMDRWRLWGYVERVAILILSALNLWWLAPVAILPRLFTASQRGQPIWQQPGGLAELLLGAAFSVILGLAF